MTNVELRDPQKVYHRLDLAGSEEDRAGRLLGRRTSARSGFPAITAINVAQPDFVKRFDAMTKSVPLPDWRTYLRWHLAGSASPWLSQKFVDEWFHFRQVLTGTKVLQPRWKRCVHFADDMMGEALAQPFVKQYLGEDGKHAVEQMVDGIETSMKADLEGLAWMDAPTRTKAEEKLAHILNKIGYPTKWRSYDGLAIDRGSFVDNLQHAIGFEVRRQLAKVGKPVDKDEWEMTPPTVNAYYEPTMNEMVFPAGILQAPFYSKTQAPALNFGAIGMVVGHELTHGFDDEGRQFDADGNLRDWWSAPVATEFDARAKCVENQFDGYVAVDDSHIKGKLTLGREHRRPRRGEALVRVVRARRKGASSGAAHSAASRRRSSSSWASRRRGAAITARRRCASWSRPTRTRPPSTASTVPSRTCRNSPPPSRASRAPPWRAPPANAAKSGEKAGVFRPIPSRSRRRGSSPYGKYGSSPRRRPRSVSAEMHRPSALVVQWRTEGQCAPTTSSSACTTIA